MGVSQSILPPVSPAQGCQRDEGQQEEAAYLAHPPAEEVADGGVEEYEALEKQGKRKRRRTRGARNSKHSRGEQPAAAAAVAAAALPSAKPCMVCYSELSCVAASQPSPGCAHSVCSTCLHHWATDRLMRRQCELRCVAGGGCTFSYDDNAVEAVLSGEERATFDELRVGRFLDPARLLYCPKCATPAEIPVAEADEEQLTRTSCPDPACGAELCAACRVAWHEGLTCEQWLALPAAQRAPEEEAARRLAASRGWMPCPACSAVVERIDGCNHVVCSAPGPTGVVCGTAFCYRCGVRYLDSVETGANVHGSPGCACGLFDYGVVSDAEEEEDGLRYDHGEQRDWHAVPPPPPAPAPLAARWVMRPPRRGAIDPSWSLQPAGPGLCHFSRTHVGCPHADKCWFLHRDENPA